MAPLLAPPPAEAPPPPPPLLAGLPPEPAAAAELPARWARSAGLTAVPKRRRPAAGGAPAAPECPVHVGWLMADRCSRPHAII